MWQLVAELFRTPQRIAGLTILNRPHQQFAIRRGDQIAIVERPLRAPRHVVELQMIEHAAIHILLRQMPVARRGNLRYSALETFRIINLSRQFPARYREQRPIERQRHLASESPRDLAVDLRIGAVGRHHSRHIFDDQRRVLEQHRDRKPRIGRDEIERPHGAGRGEPGSHALAVV